MAGPAPTLDGAAVRVIVREELAAALHRLGLALAGGAAPGPDLPPMPDDFREALVVVNAAPDLAALRDYEDAEAAGRGRDGILDAVRFRRRELLTRAAAP